jgi:hypothetical protein
LGEEGEGVKRGDSATSNSDLRGEDGEETNRDGFLRSGNLQELNDFIESVSESELKDADGVVPKMWASFLVERTRWARADVGVWVLVVVDIVALIIVVRQGERKSGREWRGVLILGVVFNTHASGCKIWRWG